MAEIKCPQCGTIISLEQSDLDSIVKQVRDEEFSRDLEERTRLLEKQHKTDVKLASEQAKAAMQDELSKRDVQIAQLKAQLDAQQERYESETKLAVSEAVVKAEAETEKLRSQLEVKELERENVEAQLKEQLAELSRAKDEVIEYHKSEIERLRDMKARLSTKMLGESLEVHCQNEFNRVRSMAFPRAYFEKDNDASDGTKGDFIFRETDEEGNEVVSIMFEMKNQEDEASTRKRNEDFFAKLDRDRTKKGCEYAVLVSLLEPDSELYNDGIVDVSHRYPKMFVIRPQFFLPIISLLRNAGLNALEYKQQAALMRQEHIDITTFESDLEQFKEGFFKSFGLASQRFDDAVKAIDKAIADLQKARENLVKTGDRLNAANNKLDGLTVKKLTRNNPTMRARFEELKAAEEE